MLSNRGDSVSGVSPLAAEAAQTRQSVDHHRHPRGALQELVKLARHRARRRSTGPAARDRQQSWRGFQVRPQLRRRHQGGVQRRGAHPFSTPTIGSLKVIIAAAAMDLLEGATLDHTATQGLVIRNPNKPKAPSVEGLISNDELSAEVETVIKVEVNPALAAHGGFVSYVGHDGEGTAYLTMGGGCHGCSMSRMTMLDGVQTMLVEQIPEIERVTRPHRSRVRREPVLPLTVGHWLLTPTVALTNSTTARCSTSRSLSRVATWPLRRSRSRLHVAVQGTGDEVGRCRIDGVVLGARHQQHRTIDGSRDRSRRRLVSSRSQPRSAIVRRQSRRPSKGRPRPTNGHGSGATPDLPLRRDLVRPG